MLTSEQHGVCTHQLTAATATCTRPEQDQANQKSNIDGNRALEALPLVGDLLIVSGCLVRDSHSSLHTWLMVGCPCSIPKHIWVELIGFRVFLATIKRGHELGG